MIILNGIVIPVPLNNFQILWLFIGMIFGRSFGKKLDYELQQTKWFKDRHPFWQGLFKRFLDFMHHWWIGAIIWLYSPMITRRFLWSSIEMEIMWFGIGLFIDDIRDFNHVLDRYRKVINEGKE